MSAEAMQTSLWDDPENNDQRPKKCPHCGCALAHRDDLKDNDEIDANGYWAAYRRHREAHFPWGDDPTEDGTGGLDPYLGSYYSNDRDALYEPDDNGPDEDPDEVVGHVYDVTISYESQLRATVVAPDKGRAKEKAEDMNLFNEEDLTGNVPDKHTTHEIHWESSERADVTRSDDRAERMEGWPW